MTRAWLALLVLLVAREGRAQTPLELAPAPPPRGLVEVGVGFLELAHIGIGVFFSNWLTCQAQVSWNGGHGNRFGAGCTYAVGAAEPDRPPRHALLVGARVMMATSFTFDSHGDDLSSYVVIPVGYGLATASGFNLQGTVGPGLIRSRTDRGHRLGLAGPFAVLSVGRWF
jgi:hypothetical protein